MCYHLITKNSEKDYAVKRLQTTQMNLLFWFFFINLLACRFFFLYTKEYLKFCHNFSQKVVSILYLTYQYFILYYRFYTAKA